jgi:SOS-response transcriptional repressor LexA
MRGKVIPITAGRREGSYVLLEAALPGRPVRPVGVLLADPDSGRGWVRMRQNFDDMADPEDAEVLAALEGDLRSRMGDSGGTSCLEFLEDCCSNVLRVGERQVVTVDAFTRVLDRLYREHVEGTEIQKFRTHVPLYTVRAAAGRLGEEMISEQEDWVPVPEGMRVTGETFAAHVAGRSMEPLIPDGSLNLFRFHPVGSRQGKILLVERFGITDETARYTVKRYRSTKRTTGEGQWEHDRIVFEPLNPEFEPWEAGAEDFAVVAEWIRVLE